MMQAYSSLNNTLHFLLLSIFLYAPQISACNLSLQGLNDIHIVFNHAYSKKSVAGRIAVEQFSVRNRGANCNFFVAFSNTSNHKLINNYGQQLSYEIYDSIQHDARIDGDLSVQTNNILSGKLNKNQPLISLNYYLHVPYNHNTAAGIYTNSVDISVYQGTMAEHVLHDTQRVHYYVLIPTDVSVSISSKSNIDFGTLQPGERRTFSVDVAANTPYDISIESENKGSLINNKNETPANILYTLQQNGRNINLKHITVLTHSRHKFRKEVNSYEFNVTIQEFDFVLSGKYQDNIIFTVIAK